MKCSHDIEPACAVCNPPTSSAVARGVEMMGIPMRDLPSEAFIFSAYMCKQYMMCGEVMLTAYCYYAQIVEGLSCDDDLYLASESIRVEWARVQYEWERVVVVDPEVFGGQKLVARWRPARVDDVFRFEYPHEPHFDRTLTVVRVDGPGPEDRVFFEDTTNSKQKDLTKVPRVPMALFTK